MKKLIMYGLLFGCCYGVAFYFSTKKVAINSTHCYMELSQTRSFKSARSDSKRTEMINNCLMTEFNAIDRHFYPSGVENMDVTYD